MVDHHVPCLDSGDCWRRELENCDTRNGMHWKMFYTFTVCVCAIHHTKLYIYIVYIYIINVYIMIYIYTYSCRIAKCSSLREQGEVSRQIFRDRDLRRWILVVLCGLPVSPPGSVADLPTWVWKIQLTSIAIFNGNYMGKSWDIWDIPL
jgi:hypothetical protein